MIRGKDSSLRARIQPARGKKKYIHMIHSVHPFPARMAVEIAFEELDNSKGALRVLDPMVGSGTSAAVAVRCGHKVIGFDTDPLAVLMTKVWCSKVNSKDLAELGQIVLRRAKELNKDIRLGTTYPRGCDDKETRKYIRFWFDPANRKQLFALSEVIRDIEDENKRNILWCAFSRMIIKKGEGVSLARDVSHSRPHKVAEISKSKAFDNFEVALDKLLAALDKSGTIKRTAEVYIGDARKLPLPDQSIDLVITSPPYLNAIDYLRGHRMSLVWMGYSIPYLRYIRATNIGSELGNSDNHKDRYQYILEKMCNKKNPPLSVRSILLNYIFDLDKMLKEVSRVLSPKGKAVFVIGNSSMHGVFVKNSVAITELGNNRGLELVKSRIRRLPANRRYLPPPSKSVGIISNRIRTETMLSFKKASIE